MIEAVGIGVVFVALAGVAFVGSVRLGMLVGHRLDQALEARASNIGGDEPMASGLGPASAAHDDLRDSSLAQEEHRGE